MTVKSIGKRIASGLLALSMVAAGFVADIPAITSFTASAATEIGTGMDPNLIWVGGSDFEVWIAGNPNNITWSSENTSQLTVTKDAVQASTTQSTATVHVKSKGDGTCKVYAKDTTTNTTYELEMTLKNATSDLTVIYNGEDVSNKDTIYIDKGESLPLRLVVDGDDSAIPAIGDGKTLTGSVDDNGNMSLKGLKKGTTSLTCTTLSGVQARSYTVVVLQPSTDSSYIVEKGKTGESSGGTMVAGHSQDYQVKFTPSSTDDVVKWSTSATAIATVTSNDDNTGSVKALRDGTCILTATVCKNSDKHEVRYTRSYILIVQKNVPATALSFIDDNDKAITEMEIVKGSSESVQLNLTKTPLNTTDVITYTSSNTSVATVDETSGVLTPKSGGDTIITAKAENDTVTAQLKVNVKVPVTSMSVSPANKVLPVGQSYPLTAETSPASADNAVIWTSSDSSVASVDAFGVITAKKTGTVTITANAKYVINENSPVNAKCVVEVVPAVPTTALTLPDGNYVALKESKAIKATCKTATGAATNDVITWTVKDADGNVLAADNTYAKCTFDGVTATIVGKKSAKLTLTAVSTSGKSDTTTVYIGKSIKNCTIANIADQPVTGKAIKPKVSVYDGTTKLTTTNYTVTYSNNINKGTAKVIVTGKGNYCPETIEKTFKIVANPTDISKASVKLAATSYYYTGKAIKPKVTITYNKKTLTTSDYTVSYSNNTYPGTATVKITGKGDDFKGTVSKTFKIKGKMSSVKVSSIASKTYTGKAITPAVTVKLGTKTLVKGTDYTVSYSSNTKVGTAKVTIKGKGNYSGSITKTFKINPAKQSISSLSALSKGFKVKYKATTTVTGYQIKYATKSSFSNAKTKTISKNKTNTVSIKGLTGKKTYYVKVRSYAKLGGKTYYGAWSSAKKITTKK